MPKFILLILLSFLLQSCANQPHHYKGYEIPQYQVIEKIDEFEIREYQPHLVAEVEVDGDRSGAAKKGFRTIASYIFGNNIESKNVAMTSPVEQYNKGEKWIVRFGMPRAYSVGDLPKAMNKNIIFRTLAAHRAIAIKFSGSWNDKKFNAQKEKLEMFVWKKGYKTVGEPVIAYYDSPFTLPWNRRNEVLIEIE